MERKHVIKLAAAASLAAAALLWLGITLLNQNHTIAYDINLACVEDLDDIHGFQITTVDLGRHIKAKKQLSCPTCGSEQIARARPCIECEKQMPTGAHGLPPDNCPHCGVAQPSPTISDHDQMHAPGAHGEEAIIVPFGEDDEPEFIESDPPAPAVTDEPDQAGPE